MSTTAPSKVKSLWSLSQPWHRQAVALALAAGAEVVVNYASSPDAAEAVV